MKLVMKDRVRHFANNNPSFSWKCGKWFVCDDEIPKHRIDRYLLTNTDCKDVAECGKWKECYIAMYGDDEADWCELKIVRDARLRLRRGAKPVALAYPLNNKELKLINYLLTGEAQYGIFFYGCGGSGKSSICNIICGIFGEDQCCYTSLQDIGKFNIELEGARLWFDDDISPEWTDSKSSRFKPIVTNGRASFEEKGRTPHSGRYRCKCLFASNHPVRFDVTDSGMLRRILYYKKDVKIENPDPTLANKKYTYEELVNIVMTALSVDMTDWYKDFEHDTHEIIMSSNSVSKYGIDKSYSSYVGNCTLRNIYPYGEDKWNELSALFKGWRDEESSQS